MTRALVPVKHLAETKSRLLPELEREALEALSLCMLRDVLAALAEAPSIEFACVVTPDPDVARAAEQAGARGLVLETPGLNPSLDAAARALDLDADEGLLVVLGDVAGVLATEIEALAQAAAALPRPSAVLAPSSDGGTSALLRTPFDAVPSCFGRDSARRHREAAAEAGVAVRALALPSLAIDLDEPDDLRRFLADARGGTHTRALLEALDWGSRPTPTPPQETP